MDANDQSKASFYYSPFHYQLKGRVLIEVLGGGMTRTLSSGVRNRLGWSMCAIIVCTCATLVLHWWGAVSDPELCQ